MTSALWSILAADELDLIPQKTQSRRQLELYEVSHCVKAGYSYSQIETCIGRPADVIPRGKMPSAAIIRTYWLADDVHMVLVFTPADTLYSAIATWPNGSKQNLLP